MILPKKLLRTVIFVNDYWQRDKYVKSIEISAHIIRTMRYTKRIK